MRRLLLLSLILLPTMALARQSAQGDCVLGGKVVVTNGLNSTTKVMASYPSCTVTVSVHGGGLATIYSDNAGTVLANPFTATTTGHWSWFADNGHYDVLINGGTPQAMPSSFTYSDILLNDSSQQSTTVCGLPFASSIVFTASTCSDFTLTLTGNVTSSTITGAVTGQQITVSACQDATGGRTLAWPSSITRPPTIVSTANACTNSTFFFDGINWRQMAATGDTLMPSAGGIAGTWSGNPTWTGNHTHQGVDTFTQPITATSGLITDFAGFNGTASPLRVTFAPNAFDATTPLCNPNGGQAAGLYIHIGANPPVTTDPGQLACVAAYIWMDSYNNRGSYNPAIWAMNPKVVVQANVGPTDYNDVAGFTAEFDFENYGQDIPYFGSSGDRVQWPYKINVAAANVSSNPYYAAFMTTTQRVTAPFALHGFHCAFCAGAAIDESFAVTTKTSASYGLLSGSFEIMMTSSVAATGSQTFTTDPNTATDVTQTIEIEGVDGSNMEFIAPSACTKPTTTSMTCPVAKTHVIPAACTITNVVVNTQVATVTCNAAHNLIQWQRVRITGSALTQINSIVGNNWPNQDHWLINSVPSATTFVFTCRLCSDFSGTTTGSAARVIGVRAVTPAWPKRAFTVHELCNPSVLFYSGVPETACFPQLSNTGTALKLQRYSDAATGDLLQMTQYDGTTMLSGFNVNGRFLMNVGSAGAPGIGTLSDATTGMYASAGNYIVLASAGTPVAAFPNVGMRVGNGFTIGFASAADPGAAGADAAFSRDAANTIDCGNGTNGDVSCTLKLATLQMSGHLNQSAANRDRAFTVTLASGTVTKTWTAAYTSAPVVVCTPTTTGTFTTGATLKVAPTTTNVVITSTTGTDNAVLDCVSGGNPN